jgi:hypothetical protein
MFANYTPCAFVAGAVCGVATFQREIGSGMGDGPRGVHSKNTLTEQRWVIDSGAGRGKLSGGARELDVLQLLEAKPLAVDRHAEVAKVDGVLGTGDLGAHHRVRCRPPRAEIFPPLSKCYARRATTLGRFSFFSLSLSRRVLIL